MGFADNLRTEVQNNLGKSIDNNIDKIFNDIKLSDKQKQRLKNCILKLVQKKKIDKNGINKTLNNFKKIINNEGDTEKGIKKIELEIKDTTNGVLENLRDKGVGLVANYLRKDTRTNNGENESYFQGIINDTIMNTVMYSNRTIMNRVKNNIDMILDLATKLSDGFKKLNAKYRRISEGEIKEKKSKLSENTKKKLAENNINEETYIKYTIRRDKINREGTNDRSPETRDFLKNLKELENSIGIRRETAKGLPLTPTEKTFENNPQLTTFKDTDPAIAELEKISYFGKEKIDITTSTPETIKTNLDIYKTIENIYKGSPNFPKDGKFQEISKKIQEDDISKLTQEDIDYYTTKLDNLNGWITDYIKGSTAQAPLTGVLRYLDSYTGFNKYTLQDRFGKGKDEFITMKDTIMRIEGIIDDKPLSFYYDTKDGQTKISCDDILHIENDKYQIYNGIGEYPKSDLKINMPSIKEIVNNFKQVNQEVYIQLLKGSRDLKDFQLKITELVNSIINETFPDNDEIKTRMARFTEKNLAAQAFDEALIGNSSFKEKINSETETGITPIKKILLLVDNTTENSTSSELVNLKSGFNKLKTLINKPIEDINKIKDPVLKTHLIALKQGKESQNYEQRLNSMTNFFSLFQRKEHTDPEYGIDINDFTTFIDIGFKDEETKKTTLESFTPEFLKVYTAQNPETKKIQEQGKKIQELSEAQHEKESEEADEELMASLETLEQTTT